jgi:ribosomal protein L40E
MGLILMSNRAFILILTSALLWTSIAWAVPWSRLNEEPEPTPAEELPTIEYDPLAYARSAYDEILQEVFDVSAVGGTWTCANCGSENPADAKYCSECGSKKGDERATGLSDVRVCPKCGFVNEKEAKFCGDCGYNFYGAGAGAAGLEMVYVPGRGYVPKGTMIEPGHARTGLWVGGVLMWLLVGPGIAVAGVETDSEALYILGGCIYLAGQILFIVGVGGKTKPVYAFRTSGNEVKRTRLAYARKSPISSEAGVKVELPLIGFYF